MKLILQSLALGAALLFSAHGFAQNYPATPAAKPAPSASAAAATKATTVENPVAAGAPGAPATTSAPAKTAKSAAAAPAPAAAGGGDGKVWVNSKSRVYHCPGTKFYGKTKAGEYMSEADAKAKGNHPNNKKACS